MVVFFKDPLTSDDQAFVDKLTAASFENGGTANLRIRRQSVDGSMDDQLAVVWENLNAEHSFTLPYLLLRSPAGQGSVVNNWHGELKAARELSLLTSPTRTELGRRLSSGDAAVWMILNSGNSERDQSVSKKLTEQLKLLSEKIPLPEGIGLPGSELFSEVPLLMRFSVLEVAPDDIREQLLIDLLHGMDPQSVKNGQPLVVPVFGRGRALEVIPADQLTDSLIEDLTVFLCGACSCQVKERNPGFDLMLNTNWNQALFGDDAEDIAQAMTSHDEDVALPVLLAVPPGAAGPEVSAELSDAADAPTETAISDAVTATAPATPVGSASQNVFWIMLGVVACVMVIVFAKICRG